MSSIVGPLESEQFMSKLQLDVEKTQDEAKREAEEAGRRLNEIRERMPQWARDRFVFLGRRRPDVL